MKRLNKQEKQLMVMIESIRNLVHGESVDLVDWQHVNRNYLIKDKISFFYVDESHGDYDEMDIDIELTPDLKRYLFKKNEEYEAMERYLDEVRTKLFELCKEIDPDFMDRK